MISRCRLLGHARALIALAVPIFLPLAACGTLRAQSAPQANPPTPTAPADNPPPPGNYVSPLPHGMKLMLKGGGYELVSKYEIQGNRVRYYSLDRSQWEVIPTSIVDWNATKQTEDSEEKNQAALLKRVEKQDAEQRAVPTLDIDASLEVAPGVFLPPGQGLFVFDGRAVVQVPQAETDSHISKTRFLEKILIPVPIVPSRDVIDIPQAHSKFRLNTRQPEFYLRTGGSREPDVRLIRAKIHHGSRQIMNVDSLMGAQQASSDSLPIQRWVVAKGVYRYTLAKKLAPGEYVVAEMLPNQGMSLYVWDFGVN